MANVKITELTALTTPVGTDVLPIVDVLGDVTKKVTVADLNSATSTTTTDGDIIIRSSGSETRLPIGSEGQALLVSSGLPVWGNVAGGYTDPLTTDGDIVIRSGGVSTRLGIGSEGQVLKVSSGLPVWAADAGGDVVLDTTPQLGGNLDVNGYDIVSASGGNVEIAPDTTGSFVIRGNNTDGSITLNCTANTHGVTIQSPPHASAATYTLILPDDTGTSGQVLSTNGTGTLSWLTATEPGDNISTLTNDSGFITSTVTGDFTVDTDTLYVDSTNNRVGIGTSSPSNILHIQGQTESGGILIEDSSGAQASPELEIIGKRSDGNSSTVFGGKICLAGNRTDDAVHNNKNIGTVLFGGNHTDGSTSNILYTASIGGVSEGTFNSSTDMPTGLAFFTGSTGRTTGTAGVTFGSERLRIDSSGYVRLSSNSPGLQFNGDTAAANALDDYEEGTWTPSIQGGTTAGSYTFTANGTYTKVGNKVTAWCDLTNITTVSAGSGSTVITGLPFVSALGFPAVGSIMLDQWDFSTSQRYAVARVQNGTDEVTPRMIRDNLSDNGLDITTKTNDDADISFCVTYTVA